MQQARDRGHSPDLPPCTARFLIDYLMEIGPVVSGGMGAAAIGWRDIEAWQRCIGITLPPWQARLLRQLSSEYLSMSHAAEKPTCAPPYSLVDQETRSKVDQQFKALASAFAHRKKR